MKIKIQSVFFKHIQKIWRWQLRGPDSGTKTGDLFIVGPNGRIRGRFENYSIQTTESSTNYFFKLCNQFKKNNNSDQNDVKVRIRYKRDEIKVFGGFL